MSLNATSILDKLISHAQRLGLFEQVQGHESKNAPGNGMHAEVWADTIDPIRASGLDATSVRLTFKIRCRTDFKAAPEDGIDPMLLDAVDQLLASLHADFELDGDARFVDLLGAHGIPLSGKAGYLNQDGKVYRVMDIVVPCIINDAWEQVA